MRRIINCELIVNIENPPYRQFQKNFLSIQYIGILKEQLFSPQSVPKLIW